MKPNYIHSRYTGKIGKKEIGYSGLLYWQFSPSYGWHISYGVSRFKVASGSPWSAPVGRKLFNRWTEK